MENPGKITRLFDLCNTRVTSKNEDPISCRISLQESSLLYLIEHLKQQRISPELTRDLIYAGIQNGRFKAVAKEYLELWLSSHYDNNSAQRIGRGRVPLIENIAVIGTLIYDPAILSPEHIAKIVIESRSNLKSRLSWR